WFAVSVNIGNYDVMRAGCVVIEYKPLEWLLARMAGVAIPHSAAHQIDPTVPIHVQRRQADVGQEIRADEMLHPTVGRLKFKPVKPARVERPSTENEIEIAVTIQIHQRR